MYDSRYEAKLAAFAEGKRLRRLRGNVRNPKDSTCDACGSALPNLLWGLRDMADQRDYFVGSNCLAGLARMLVIERPIVRANVGLAYERARLSRPAASSTDAAAGHCVDKAS